MRSLCRVLIPLMLLPAAACSAPEPAAPDSTGQSASAADSLFADLSARYLDSLARLNPSSATGLGDHRFDGEVTDLSAGGRAARLESDKALLAELMLINRNGLSRSYQVDAAMLENALRYAIWREEVLQDWAWDPQIYNSAAGGSLYNLAARDFAPWADRLASAIERMEKVPHILAQARANLDPARVPPVMASTVAAQNSGIVSIAETMLAPHADVLDENMRKRFDAALKTLKTAVKAHQDWLNKTLVPAAKGDFRLGTELYDRKLAFALMSPMSRAEIKAAAETAITTIRAEMYVEARRALENQVDAPATPENPNPAQQQAAIEAALERSYAKRPDRDKLIETARKTLAIATEFARDNNLITVPNAPVKIITMPKFQQGYAVAYCDSPGPLEKHLDTFYAVSPVPEDWSDEQAASFLREYNDMMIHVLSIHEAVPGHYLQIAHSNDHPSQLRSVLGSGPFIEGWAVYSENAMMDAGYLDGDPLFKLSALKFRLRAVVNALLDIKIQTEGMTRAEAMKLMTQTAFQQEREAAGKWTRANLASAQLPTYFVGYAEHKALRASAEARDGDGFDQKAYHDEVLAHGSPPVRYVRALMFDEPIK